VAALQRQVSAAPIRPQGGGRGAASPTVKAAKGAGALGDFMSYHQVSTGMLQQDVSNVSGRRLANVRAKYLLALKEAGITLPEGVDVAFVINGALIQASWSGEKPAGLSAELDV
jgi:hypothetical protein